MKIVEPNIRKPRGETRLRLITAAEKLFGEKGIHAVTLKEINAAADQRNESALHYHFGSKASLVLAILSLRAKAVDQDRFARIEALMKSGHEKDLGAVLKATFLPITDLLITREGVRFVRFLAQVLSDPDFDLPDMLIRGDLPGVAKANTLLIAAQGDIAPEISIQRLRHLVEMVVSALAMWTRRNDSLHDLLARELFVANLLDSIAGFLTAPVSDDTLGLLRKSLRQKETT